MNHQLLLEPPRCALRSLRSTINHPKSNHEKLIATHWFNRKVSIFIPTTQKDANAKTIMDDIIADYHRTTPSFYEVQASIHHFLHPHFLDTYVRCGKVYLLSRGRIDSGNVVCIAPAKKLILRVDKDTYEQLGLVGSSSKAFTPKDQYFTITIDLSSKKFLPGQRLYDRVMWCVKDRLGPGSFFVAHVSDDGSLSEIDFSKFNDDHTMTWEQVSSRISKRLFTNIKVPILDDAKVIENGVRDFDTDIFMSQFYEYLGLIHCNLDDLISLQPIKQNELVSEFRFELPFYPKANGYFVSMEGFITPDVVLSIFRKVHEKIVRAMIPYGVVSVCGDDDSPVSWGSCEHGVLQSGENGYTIVVLPRSGPDQDDRYWLYSAVSANDLHLW